MNLTLAASLALTVLALTAGGASARTLSGQTSLVPASPSTTDTLHVSYRPSAGGRSNANYTATVFVLARHTDTCRGSLTVTLEKKSDASQTLTADLAPQGSHIQPYPWCSGRALLSVFRDNSALGLPDRRVARRVIKLRLARPSDTLFGTPTVIQVLATSTATVSAPGRPDRTLGLGGVFAGFIPGKFVLNTDYVMQLKPTSAALGVTPSGLTVRSLVTDPLCSSGAIQTSAPLASSFPSQLTFQRNGVVTAKLTLDADPSTLAGCAGGPSGTVAIDLTGKLGTALLSDVLLTGTVAGVPVGGGVGATVSLALHIKVSIFD